MKKLLLIGIVLVVAGVTLPLWGSCDLNAKACSAWCSARHFNSDVKTAACKAQCTTDKLSCLANKGAQKIEGMLKGSK